MPPGKKQKGKRRRKKTNEIKTKIIEIIAGVVEVVVLAIKKKKDKD